MERAGRIDMVERAGECNSMIEVEGVSRDKASGMLVCVCVCVCVYVSAEGGDTLAPAIVDGRNQSQLNVKWQVCKCCQHKTGVRWGGVGGEAGVRIERGK